MLVWLLVLTGNETENVLALLKAFRDKIQNSKCLKSNAALYHVSFSRIHNGCVGTERKRKKTSGKMQIFFFIVFMSHINSYRIDFGSAPFWANISDDNAIARIINHQAIHKTKSDLKHENHELYLQFFHCARCRFKPNRNFKKYYEQIWAAVYLSGTLQTCQQHRV